MKSLTRRRFFFLTAGSVFATGAAVKRKSDLDRLARTLKGRVVLPSTAGWDQARKLWNSRFDSARPRAIVEVAGVDDVGKVVRFARDHDLRLIARNGRHSFAGDSTGDDVIVVDVSRLNAIEVDGNTARFGAGVTLLPAYRALWQYQKAIAGGRCPTVGLTGLTTVGGIGYLTRMHGPTCDSLRSAEIVDAEGKLLRADANENADLFWALRGAGAGSFGIITSLTMRLVPVDMPFTSVELDFPWSAAAKVLTAWQQWGHAAPRNVASLVELVTQAPGKSTPAISIEIAHSGDPTTLKPLLAELVDTVGVAPSHTEQSTGAWFNLAGDAYCKGLRPQECRDAEISHDGKLPRLAFYGKSDVAVGEWPSAGFETIVEWMDKRQRDRTLTPDDFSDTHNIGKVFLEASDGAVNDIPRNATAFVHRGKARFITQFQVRWRAGAPQSTIDANLEWVNGLYAAVAPHRSGMAYQGYMDAALPDWQVAYYVENFPRLQAIKWKYDPDDFFRFARSITPHKPNQL